jgi:multidrug efflux pump subunit AcrA (membrane-fusion protein)
MEGRGGGSSSAPATPINNGPRSLAPGDPVVVHVIVNDRTVQEISTRATQLKAGRK